jgi:hypothetical protein
MQDKDLEAMDIILIGIVISLLAIVGIFIYRDKQVDINHTKSNSTQQCVVLDKIITGQDKLFYNIFVKC